MAELYGKNCDILYLYDAKLCNPNGDPDDENKPRMDYETGKNLVSDVRLKRYIRDYLQNKKCEIFVAKVNDKSVTATARLQALFKKHNKKTQLKKMSKEDCDWLLNQLIDVRMFGATMPIKAEVGEGAGGASAIFTGPIQFNWGYSLNRVTIVPSNTITTHFAAETEKGSTMGKDYRLYYALVAFHGVISKTRAQKTLLSDEDIKLLDESLLKAVPAEATTRSKIGQFPRLIVRVEYKDDTFLGDLRRYICIKPKEEIKEEKMRDVMDFELDVSKLMDLFNRHKDYIEKVFFFQDESLKLEGENSFEELLNKANLPNEKIK
jgi:CRISPR-associated protein Csh2